jgi:cytochrome c553
VCEQDSADLAAWFASLPAAQNQVSKQDLSKAKVLVDQGNGKKILPPCFTCHGGSGEGQRMDTPALAGQIAYKYLKFRGSKKAKLTQQPIELKRKKAS